jgi:hypothetical protein
MPPNYSPFQIISTYKNLKSTTAVFPSQAYIVYHPTASTCIISLSVQACKAREPYNNMEFLPPE